jgi:hypothetical protein
MHWRVRRSLPPRKELLPMTGQFVGVAGSRRRLMDAMVRLVAERSLAAVSNLVDGRMDGMSLCETRGYIRARAGQVVRRQSRAVMQCENAARAAWENALVARATERVVALVVRQGTSGCMRRAA